MHLTPSGIAFYLIAALVLGSASVVAFSRNIVYSAFALLGTLIGTAALYITLSADFLAATQVIVYIGGIAVLFLFAVMLTQRIETAHQSNPHFGLKQAVPLGAAGAGFALAAALGHPWNIVAEPAVNPTVRRIGNAFLSEYLLPFEFASVILLVVLIGAALVARREIHAKAHDRADSGPALGTEPTLESSDV